VLCPHCHGKHIIILDGHARPCAECGGLGAVHCCEGLQAQPEPPAQPDQPTATPDGRPAAVIRARSAV
jgi:hypothetical protein